MPTSYDQFRRPSFAQQLPLAWGRGTYLARRREEEGTRVLCYMAGSFLAENYLSLLTRAPQQKQPTNSSPGQDTFN